MAHGLGFSDFTPEDLAANKNGTITPRQHERLVAYRRGSQWLFPFATVVALAIGFFLIGRGQDLLMVIFFGFAALFAFLIYKSFRQDISTVVTVEGAPNIMEHQKNGRTRYRLRLQNHIFFIDEADLLRLQGVQNLRVYTIKDGGVILSAEIF